MTLTLPTLLVLVVIGMILVLCGTHRIVKTNHDPSQLLFYKCTTQQPMINKLFHLSIIDTKIMYQDSNGTYYVNLLGQTKDITDKAHVIKMITRNMIVPVSYFAMGCVTC